MSREWYIRTDRRRLTAEPSAPLTKKERWQRYGKRWLLWGIEAALLVALVVFTLTQVLRKTPRDYTLLLVTLQPASVQTVQTLQTSLAACGEDRDGDGTVIVDIRNLVVGGEAQNNTAREQMLQYLIHGDPPFFAMEPAAYARYVAPYIADDGSLFAALPTGDTLWEKDGLLFGVRTQPAITAEQAAHLTLLQNYTQEK